MITASPVDRIPEPALLIGAERRTRGSGGTHQHLYAATGKPTRVVPLAGANDVDDAVRAGRQAHPAWRIMSAGARRDLLFAAAQLLRSHAEELALLTTIDNGTPARAAAYAAPTAAESFAYYAGWADKHVGDVVPIWPERAFDYTSWQPYGVVAVIIPWNGPVQALGMTLAPALAAGNCVVVKPPELSPFAAQRFGELLIDAGFPAGVVNVVTGDATTGAALVSHPGIDKIHFTGSGSTARAVLDGARDGLTPVALELGGKSARLVFDDADVDDAADQIIRAAAALSGQACIAGTRALIHESVYGDVVDAVAARSPHVPIGDPLDPATGMGPVITRVAQERIFGVIDSAVNSGDGRLIAGGHRLDGDLADGFFVPPTFLGEVDPTSALARDEVFGPVVALFRFADEQEAVEMANDTDYGLAAYIQTQDLTRAHRVAAQLSAGAVFVNGMTGIPAGAPFGGVKASGYGRLGGRAGLEEFSQLQNVYVGL